jgi:predicted metalloenzyme YecM
MRHPAADVTDFLDRLFGELEAVELDVATYIMDHVCFRTVSTDDYEQTKAAFAAAGQLLIESNVNGRPIATYRLHQPVVHRGRVVRVVEVPAPKPRKVVQRGFEHAEFVIGESFESFAQRHPALAFEHPTGPAGLNQELGLKLGTVNVKFHHLPLDAVIELERDKRLLQAIERLGVFGPLARFHPHFSGSLPLALAVPGSDVDVLFESADLDAFDREAASCLATVGTWHQHRTDLRGQPTSLYRIDLEGFRFEWIAQTIPVHHQAANRHLLIEARLLNVAGEEARQAIQELKGTGMKTEPAFATHFALPGDPYLVLLDLEGETEQALCQRFGPQAD